MTKVTGVLVKHAKALKIYADGELRGLLKNIVRIEQGESEVEGEHRYSVYKEGASVNEDDYLWLNNLEEQE